MNIIWLFMAGAYHSIAQGRESIPANKLESRDRWEHSSSIYRTWGTVTDHHVVSGKYAPYVEDLM